MLTPPERVAFGDWCEAVHIEDTAVFTSLFTGEVLLRCGPRDYDFFSWSGDQRKQGPLVDRWMLEAVVKHAK